MDHLRLRPPQRWSQRRWTRLWSNTRAARWSLRWLRSRRGRWTQCQPPSVRFATLGTSGSAPFPVWPCWGRLEQKWKVRISCGSQLGKYDAETSSEIKNEIKTFRTLGAKLEASSSTPMASANSESLQISGYALGCRLVNFRKCDQKKSWQPFNPKIKFKIQMLI